MGKKFPLAEHFVLKGYVDAVANKAGLTAQFSDHIKVPMTSGNKLMIPRPNSNMTETDGKKLRHWVLHETLHHTEGSDIFNVMQREGLDPSKDMIGRLLNMFEDDRIERVGSQKYEGDKQILDDGMGILLPNIVNTFNGFGEEQWKDKQTQVMAAAVGLDVLARAGWQSSAALGAHDFLNAVPDSVRRLIEGLAEQGWVDRIENLSSAEDSLELANELWEEIADEPPPPPSGGGGEDQGEEGDGSSGDEGKSSQEQSGDGQGDGEGQGEGEGDDGKDNKAAQAKQGDSDGGDEIPTHLKDVEFSHHEWHDAGYQSSGVNISYPEDSTAYDFASFSEIYVADIVNMLSDDPMVHREINDSGGDYHVTRARNDYDRLVSKHTPSRGFSNKVRQLLQVKSQAYYVGGHKKGKLNSSQLFRAGCPKVGEGEWNKTVYKKKVDSDLLDVAVFVLVDGSGSMGGSRYAHATESARMLNHSISKTLKIPTMIGVFSEADGNHGTDGVIAITKHFDKPISDDKLLENMARATTFMSVNPDGDCLMWAHHVLKQRKEKRKVLVVLSDGQPTGSRSGNSREYTKQVAKSIEQEGIVDIAAIGIESKAPCSIYSDAQVIHKPEELEQALLGVIKRKIMA